MKLNRKTGFIFLLAGFLASAGLGPQNAAAAAGLTAQKGVVSKVTVTFYGDTASAKGFTWYTAPVSTGSDVQVVEKTAARPDFSKGAAFTGNYSLAARAFGDRPEIIHKAEAAGLKPGTEYYFRVGDSALDLWSATGTFQTAPSSGAFTFIDLADPQAKTEEECALSAATIAKAFGAVPGAKFLAINGDLVDNGGNEAQWNWLLGRSRASLMNTTLLPAAGNHEPQKNAFAGHFHLKAAPGSDTASGVYYSVDYANAHFIVLNNNEDSSEYADFTPAQIAWLKADAAAAKKAGAQWLIVVMHKGPYTTSYHATDKDIAGKNGVRRKVAPLLAELGADLVLQGHDHIYARTKPLKADGTPAPAAKTSGLVDGKKLEYLANPGGTVYLIPATAGPKVYPKNKEAPAGYYDLFEVADEHHAAAYSPRLAKTGKLKRGVIQNFTAVTIDGGKLTAVSYEIDQNKDGARPYIIDRFGIVKESAAPGRAK